MDWFAVVSRGVFPVPITTKLQRAVYAVSAGLFVYPIPAPPAVIIMSDKGKLLIKITDKFYIQL